MGAATLNIWVTRIGDFCHIGDTTEWFVNIVDCDGHVLKWCDKEYRDLPTKCGHLEVEIPPGCYAVFAVENPKGIPPFGNQLTHLQVVRANCCDHICVTLFAPSAHLCGSWFGSALRGNLNGLVKAGVAVATIEAAIEAVQRVVREIPTDTVGTRLAAFGAPDREKR